MRENVEANEGMNLRASESTSEALYGRRKNLRASRMSRDEAV